MTEVSVCMIMKDEEEVLERCLTSLDDFPDELIIVDTGSTDKSVEIAEKFGAKVHHFEWVDDFAKARNFSFSLATKDYILWIDADDLLLPSELQKLKNLKSNLTADMYIMLYDYCQDEKGKSLSTLKRERIIKNDPKFQWTYPIHECISLGGTTVPVDITITHKRTNDAFCADIGRNIRILKKALEGDYKNDPRVQYYLAKEYFDVGRIEEAVPELEKFLDMNDGWWEDIMCARVKLAQALQGLGKHDEAKRAALHAIELDDRWAEPYYTLGMLAWDRKDWYSAIRWFEACCRLEKPNIASPIQPKYYTWLPYLQLAVMYAEIGDWKKSNEANEKAAQWEPHDPNIVHNRIFLTDKLHKKEIPTGPKRLNLGSGNKRYLDYTSCDLFSDTDVDEVFSLDEIPYEDETIDAIHSEHALEHLPHVNACEALREWYRVLKPGADLHLQLPDLKHCCQKYIEAVNVGDKKLQDWYKWTLYGRQITDGREDRGQFHQTGFSLEEMIKELEDIGFVIDYSGHYDGWSTPSLEVRALKPIDKIRIGWVTGTQDLTIPQYRIRTFHIDRWLRSRGYISKVIQPSEMDNYDVLIFGRGPSDYEHIKEAHEKGKRAILDLCEDLFQFGDAQYTGAIRQADLVVCCSYTLAAKVKHFNENVVVIEDAVEVDFNLNCEYEGGNKLKVGWIGMGGNAAHAEQYRELIESKGFELVTIHELDDATIKWDLNTWQQELAKCDIAIAPINEKLQPCKSNNKLTTYMALGLPVIASPLDAYTRIIKNEKNGFIAREMLAEWSFALERLKDPALRRKIGQAGKEAAYAYSLDTIGSYWRDLLTQKVVNRTVDIIVTTYGGGAYLDECLKSVEECTSHPHNIIIVDAKAKGYNFSQTINEGIRQSKADYVCFLNDDVIVTKGWLKPLVDSIQGNVGFVNPLSNCDKGWLHNYELALDGVPLGPGINTLHEGKVALKADLNTSVAVEKMYEFKFPSRKVYQRDWVAFFCTVLSKEVINKTGTLDPEFHTGCEDLDYCRRANKQGYIGAINESSFVFHFGGVSRSAHEGDVGHEQHQKEDEYNHNRIKLKYDKPLIVINTGYAFENWDANVAREKGSGGSEFAAARMAEELAKLGHRVVVFAQTGKENQIIENVEWCHGDKWKGFLDTHHIDICIISRYANFLDYDIRAEQTWLWCHDIFAMECKFPNGRDRIKHYLDNGKLTGVLALSEWHKEFLSEHHGIPKDKITITGNGIDLSLVQGKEYEKQPQTDLQLQSR